MAHKDAERIVENLLSNLATKLVHENMTVGSEIALSNAVGWGYDSYNNLRAWFEGYGKIKFSVEIILSGEQLPDKSPLGDTVKAKIEGNLAHENENWKINFYQVSQAKLVD